MDEYQICDLEQLRERDAFLKKPSKSARLSAKYKRISLHMFTAWVHSTSPGEQAPTIDSNRTHWNPIFNFAIPDLKRKKRERILAQYTSTKVLLEDHMENVESMKYGIFVTVRYVGRKDSGSDATGGFVRAEISDT